MSDTIPSSAGWRHPSGNLRQAPARHAGLALDQICARSAATAIPLFGGVEARMNDPHPGIFGRSVADGRGFAAELGMLEPRNAAERRSGRLRLQVSDRDPITRPQPLAQIAVAGTLA